MREIRPSGSEGGVALCAIPTPMNGGPMGLETVAPERHPGCGARAFAGDFHAVPGGMGGAGLLLKLRRRK